MREFVHRAPAPPAMPSPYGPPVSLAYPVISSNANTAMLHVKATLT